MASTRTPEDQKAFEIQAYGMTEAQVVINNQDFTNLKAVSMLSDVQELLGMGMLVEANQYINRVKFLLDRPYDRTPPSK